MPARCLLPVSDAFAASIGLGAEEVAAAVPAGILLADQKQVRLVDQGGRLQSLAGRQPAGQRRGQPAQLILDDRQQFRRRLHFRRVFLVGHGTPPVSPGEKTKNRDGPVRLFSDG